MLVVAAGCATVRADNATRPAAPQQRSEMPQAGSGGM
jgi:hypothetical protein